jgi:hypothetical protein
MPHELSKYEDKILSSYNIKLIVYELNILYLDNSYGLYYNFSMKKYHKTACTSLPEEEHLDVRRQYNCVNSG